MPFVIAHYQWVERKVKSIMSRRPIRIRAIRKPLDVEKYVAALLELALTLTEQRAGAADDQSGEAA